MTTDPVSLLGAIDEFQRLLRFAAAMQSDHPARPVLSYTTSPDRVAELRALPYELFLQSPEWIETAIRMKWLAGLRCESCGAQERLNVHHLTYERRGAELASDLVVLCERCHLTFHRVMPT